MGTPTPIRSTFGAFLEVQSSSFGCCGAASCKTKKGPFLALKAKSIHFSIFLLRVILEPWQQRQYRRSEPSRPMLFRGLPFIQTVSHDVRFFMLHICRKLKRHVVL